MKAQPFVTLLIAALSLSACDPLALGYLNRLPHSVTVVERGGKFVSAPIHLAAGERRQPAFGDIPETIELRDSADHVTARYRTSDIPRIRGAGDMNYVIITRSGLVKQSLPRTAATQ
jgi:hypothetical protein